MIRPCFLVVDREYPGSISTRKLVIETAKFNVLTAYSGVEALEILHRFPALSGVVLDAGLEDVPCGHVVRAIKTLMPTLPTIVICGPADDSCPEADFQLESFEPAKLLETLKQIKPEATRQIEERNEALSTERLTPASETPQR